MNSATGMKDSRLEVKTTQDAKDFLTKAASLCGMNLSSFLVSSSMERARILLRDHATIQLSQEGQLNLVRLLQGNQPPTEAMKSLRSRPRLEVRE